MTDLPESFKARMKADLGAEEYERFIASYSLPPVRGLRVNTLKVSTERFLELCPWETDRAETLGEGLILTGEAEHIGTHPYHLAGLFYMQEPSAMSVIEEAGIRPGMKVLDLCAAPGGKSGGAAARLGGEGLLVANEIVPSRARELAGNLERLGVVNAAVTNARPEAVASALPRFFDRVLVDAPCSGEGMFRKDETAVREWYEGYPAVCAERQLSILSSAAGAAAVGGKLIYSTCTFSKEEDEGVIEAFLKAHPEFELEKTSRLYPHTVRGEGHFSARLLKTREGESDLSAAAPVKDGAGRLMPLNLPQEQLAEEFFARQLEGSIPFSQLRAAAPREKGAKSRLLYCPFDIPDGLLCLKNILSIGIEIGECQSVRSQDVSKRFRPAHAFYMAAHGFRYRHSVDLGANDPRLFRFLGGNTIDAPGSIPDGSFVPVTVEGWPVGFGKAVGGVLKNHIPKGLSVPSYR